MGRGLVERMAETSEPAHAARSEAPMASVEMAANPWVLALQSMQHLERCAGSAALSDLREWDASLTDGEECYAPGEAGETRAVSEEPAGFVAPAAGSKQCLAPKSSMGAQACPTSRSFWTRCEALPAKAVAGWMST